MTSCHIKPVSVAFSVELTKADVESLFHINKNMNWLIVSSQKVIIPVNLHFHHSCQSHSNENGGKFPINNCNFSSVWFYGTFMAILWSFVVFGKKLIPVWNNMRVSKHWQNVLFLLNCLFKLMSVCIPWALHVFSHFWQLCHSENRLQLIEMSRAAAYKTQRHIFTLPLSAYGWCSFCSSLLFLSCSMAWAGA